MEDLRDKSTADEELFISNKAKDKEKRAEISGEGLPASMTDEEILRAADEIDNLTPEEKEARAAAAAEAKAEAKAKAAAKAAAEKEKVEEFTNSLNPFAQK